MAPLAAGPDNVEQAVQQAAHVGGAWPTSGLGRRDEWRDQAILVIAQGLAGSKIADQRAILGCPHDGLQTGEPPGKPSARPSSSVKPTTTPFQNGLLYQRP